MIDLIKVDNASTFILPKDWNPLTPIQQAVLGLGLKFLPQYSFTTPQCIKSLEDSIQPFIRRTKLDFHFPESNTTHEAPTYSTTDERVIPPKKSSWEPDLKDPIICTIHNFGIDLVSNLKLLQYPKCASKLHSMIIKHLRTLSRDPNIVIKPADKNLGTAVMSVSFYSKMCLDILNDKTTYEVINADDLRCNPEFPYIKLSNIVPKEEHFMNNKLHESLHQLLDSKELRFGRFYALPKLHKDSEKIAGRPIVSTVNTATYHTSVYIHNVLYPILKYIPQVCTSSLQTIRTLDNENFTIKEDDLIGVADVVSLYPSIPIEFGCKAIRLVLNEFSTLIKITACETNQFIELVQWVLENNYFEFDGTVYKQIQGTAMGTPMAVVYANLVLYTIEKSLINVRNTLYFRYIDDLFLVGNRQDIQNFFDAFNNNAAKTIKLDAIKIDTTGVFLDLELNINRETRKVEYKTYQKKTNKYQYITPHSAHSNTIKKNFIINEIKRYRISCFHDEDFFKIKREFYKRLRNRGYSESYLDPLFKLQFDHNDLVRSTGKKATEQNQKKPYLIMTIPKMHILGIKSLFTFPEHISESKRFKEVYGNKKEVILARKHGKNMLKYFLHKNLPPTESTSVGGGV